MKLSLRSRRLPAILALLAAFMAWQHAIAATNVVDNGGFESGKSGWNFYTNAKGSFTVFGPGDGSSNAAVVTTTTVGTNIQLYQSGVSLQPNTAYRLTFSAFSNSGRDLRVSVQKHGSPYTSYGLRQEIANLGTGWKTFTYDFTTTGFSAPVSDARLMFWFASDARSGDQFRIDNVSLTAGGSSGTGSSTGTGGSATPDAASNVVDNPGFESGKSDWNFYTNAKGSFTVFGPGDGSSNAAVVTTTTVGTNIQLYQSGVSLQPNTAYRLTFSAFSNSGRDLEGFSAEARVTLHQLRSSPRRSRTWAPAGRRSPSTSPRPASVRR